VDKYLIISADCHAELPTEKYREYVDPEYREDFEAYLVEKAEQSRHRRLHGRGVRRAVVRPRTARASPAAGTWPGVTRSSTATAWPAR
jgi:hypothetical protein